MAIMGETRFLAKYPQYLMEETETGFLLTAFLLTTSDFFIERNFTMPGGSDDKMDSLVTTDYTDFTDFKNIQNPCNRCNPWLPFCLW